MFTSLQYSDIFTGCLSEPEFPIRLHASVSTLSPPPRLLISRTFYICTLLLDLFALVLTPASSKFHSISARQKVIMFSLKLWSFCLELTVTAHKKSFNYWHLQVCPKNLSLQPPRIWLAHICLICCKCDVCGMCGCVCMRGEERERERVCNRCDCVSMYWCIIMQSLRETFV